MIKMLTRLLGNIVGRIKKNMTNILLTIATICLPLGFYLLIEGLPNMRWASATMIIISGVLLLFLMLRVRDEEKREALQRIAFYKLLSEIHEELRGLRETENERNHKPN